MNQPVIRLPHPTVRGTALRRASPRFAGDAGDARGVTLVEILVVLALMGVLMGLGVSMYTNLGKQSAFSANVGRVLSAINRVRNSSQSHPAQLQILAGNPEKGEENGVRGLEHVTFFESQCERPQEGEDPEFLRGALGRDGILPAGGVRFLPGMIGDAMFLEGGGAVDCGNYAAYDATEGIFIDVAIFPLSNRGGTLISRGEGLELALERNGDSIVARLQLGLTSGNEISAVREVAVFEAREFALPMKKWSRLVVSYDRSHVIIAVDAGRGPVERLKERETRALAPTTTERLFVGGGGGKASTFHGYIDDVRIKGILGEQTEPFPHPMAVDGPSRRIHFLGGRLDPAFHSRPETISIRSGKRIREIIIGTEGNIVDK